MYIYIVRPLHIYSCGHAMFLTVFELIEADINVYSLQIYHYESCPCSKDQTMSWDQTVIFWPQLHLPLV